MDTFHIHVRVSDTYDVWKKHLSVTKSQSDEYFRSSVWLEW